MPDFELKLAGEMAAFHRLVLVRCLREDRTAAAVIMGITLTACPGGGVSKYGAPPSDDTSDTAALTTPTSAE